jgi:hypothetical protein
MAATAALSAAYERLHPGAVRDEAQKAERMQRLVRADKAPAPSRRGSSRGAILVPALPWKEAS